MEDTDAIVVISTVLLLLLVLLRIFVKRKIRVDTPCKCASLQSAVKQQEAQLSQRDRAPLRVIKYFAKSLKITEGHSK